MDGNDLQALHDGGLGGVFRRNQHPHLAIRLGAQRDRQYALARAHGAGEREFADDDKIVELVGFELFARGEHAEGDGQIEAGALLFHVGGREVDGRAAHRKFVAGIHEGGGDAVARFLHRRVGQADDDDQGVALTGVDLHFNGVRFNAIDGGGTNLGKHGKVMVEPARKRNADFSGAGQGWQRSSRS